MRFATRNSGPRVCDSWTSRNFMTHVLSICYNSTSVSSRSPNWRTDSSAFPINTTPSEDSDLLLKNDTLWLLDEAVLLGLRNDSCDPLEDESVPFWSGSSPSCHQESSTLFSLLLTLGASILFSLRRLSSLDTAEGRFCTALSFPDWVFPPSCSSAFSIQEL